MDKHRPSLRRAIGLPRSNKTAVQGRRRFIRNGGFALAGAVAAPVIAGVPSAEASSFPGPLGVWREVVNIDVGQTVAHQTFHIDGTMLSTSDGRPLPIGQFQPCRVGLWQPTGARSFEYFFSEFIYDANGAWIGWRRPHARATLAPDCQSYTTTATVGLVDTTGKLLTTFPANSVGNRLTFPTQF